jgi:hypothetical protein
MKISPLASFSLAALASLLIASTATAQTKQSFTATVDGKSWESDHDGITVVPVTMGSGNVTIMASTKGFSGYPPPKGFADKFTLMCPLPKAAVTFPVGTPSSTQCYVKLVRAERSMMSPDYKTTPNEGEFTSEVASAAKGSVIFSKVAGKLIEGDFKATLTDKKTKKTIAVEGKFKGLDEQVGSKGFN